MTSCSAQRGATVTTVTLSMLEAVGEQYWPTYFATIDRLLAPGGKVSIQAITMSHERMLETRRSFSWIQKYIFPGGIIPSLQAIDESLMEHTTLRVSHRREPRSALRRDPQAVARPIP
jgi:cyclopropane-fatty-acyl-phospholipid synthase